MNLPHLLIAAVSASVSATVVTVAMQEVYWRRAEGVSLVGVFAARLDPERDAFEYYEAQRVDSRPRGKA